MRPQRVINLMNYISDKEPLIYLFLINSDFIEDDGKLLPNGSPAGVMYNNKRINFIYNPNQINEMTKEELFFLIIHEAFHILKKHFSRHMNLYKINPFYANCAEDACINHEIIKMKFNYELKAKMPEGGILPQGDFLNDFYNLGDDAIETHRIFDWYLKKAKENKNKSLKRFKDFFNKKTEERGSLIKVNEDGSFKLIDKEGNVKDHNCEDLIPIISPDSGGSIIPYDNEAIFEQGFDTHFNEETEKGEDFESLKEEIERNNFIEVMIEQASRIEEKIRSKNPGREIGKFTQKIKEINKPKVNWRKELRKNMNKFICDNSYLKDKIKSPINYAWDAKSNYGILGKHFIQTVHKLTNYIIFAIDTSGSCFSSSEEMMTFFSELDGAAKELEFNKTGKILTIQWDYSIKEDLKLYKRGSWKNMNLKGGGGTSPRSVFDYLHSKTKENGSGYLFDLDGIKFTTRSKKDLPLIVFLTDGYFNRIYEEDLGIYMNNPKNVLWITRETRSIYPKENFIKIH